MTRLTILCLFGKFAVMRLAEYLKSENLKPSHLALRLSVPASTITRLAKGERKPSLDLAKKIADATDGHVTPNDFAGIDSASSDGAAA